MTDERRLHQCHKDGCESEATFSTKVRILCRAVGVAPVPLAFQCSIKVCAKHALEYEVRRYLMQPQNVKQMTAGIIDAGYPEPDFLSLHVVFEPISAARVAILASAPLCCDREGCSKTAHWQVVQLFPMMWQRKRDAKPLIQVLTKLVVCDEHKAAMKPKDLMDQESKSTTLAWLSAKGVQMPDFKRMTLGFEPLDGNKRHEPKAWVGDQGPRDQFTKATET